MISIHQTSFRICLLAFIPILALGEKKLIGQYRQREGTRKKKKKELVRPPIIWPLVQYKNPVSRPVGPSFFFPHANPQRPCTRLPFHTCHGLWTTFNLWQRPAHHLNSTYFLARFIKSRARTHSRRYRLQRNELRDVVLERGICWRLFQWVL